MSNGSLTVLAIFDKPDAGDGPVLSRDDPGDTIPAPGPRAARECERVAQAALDAIGITHGPVHIELMVQGREVRVIEVAARSIGGLCSKSLNFGLMGTSLETLILRNALGMDKPELHRESVASGVLMIPIPKSGRLVEIRNTDAVRQLPHVTGMDITVPPGSNPRTTARRRPLSRVRLCPGDQPRRGGKQSSSRPRALAGGRSIE